MNGTPEQKRRYYQAQKDKKLQHLSKEYYAGNRKKKVMDDKFHKMEHTEQYKPGASFRCGVVGKKIFACGSWKICSSNCFVKSKMQ